MIEIDLRHQLGPCRDQGETPSCLAFAVTAAHEQALTLGRELSAEYLHYFATKGDTARASNPGAIQTALEASGQPLASDISPPVLGKAWVPPAGLRVHRRKSKKSSSKFPEVVEIMRSGKVPVLGIGLPPQFFRPSSPWLIDGSGHARALHAVAGVALGTIAGRRAILVRNSWGPAWGDQGHAWLDDSFIVRHLHDVITLSEAIT